MLSESAISMWSGVSSDLGIMIWSGNSSSASNSVCTTGLVAVTWKCLLVGGRILGRRGASHGRLVIVTGFKTRPGLRVGYAGYGYGLDFVTLTEPVPSAWVSGLPVRDPSHL